MSIDWRKKVDEKFLYTKDEKLKGKPISEIEDSKLLIKLGGIIEVANQRGFEEVSYEVVKAELNHVVVKCRIKWSEREIDGVKLHSQVFESIASANRDNADDFWYSLLETCAENRAFVRAVRKYLGINIVGEDEIKKAEKVTTVVAEAPNPLKTLQTLMTEKGIDGIEGLKTVLRAHVKKLDKTTVESIKNWTDLSDIRPKEARMISGILQE